MLAALDPQLLVALSACVSVLVTAVVAFFSARYKRYNDFRVQQAQNTVSAVEALDTLMRNLREELARVEARRAREREDWELERRLLAERIRVLESESKRLGDS